MIPDEKQKNFEQAKLFVTKVAEHKGWKLNPDEQFLNDLIEGLKETHNRYGYFLCPCREAWGEREQDKDVICPCDYCVPDQKDYGHCFCALFLTEEFYNSGKEPASIPERRPPDLIP